MIKARRLILTLTLIVVAALTICVASTSTEQLIAGIFKNLYEKSKSRIEILNVKCAKDKSILNITLKIGSNITLQDKLCKCSKGLCTCSVKLPPLGENKRYCYATKVNRDLWIIELSINTPQTLSIVPSTSLIKEYLIYFKGDVNLVDSIFFLAKNQVEIYCSLMKLEGRPIKLEGTSYLLYMFKPEHKLSVTKRTVCSIASSRELTYKVSLYTVFAAIVVVVSMISALSIYLISLRRQRV